MALLDSWTRGEHTADGITHVTFRKGSGPGVVVTPEIPGLSPAVIGFAEEVVDAGYTVVMPELFGEPEATKGPVAIATTVVRACLNKEFNKLAPGQTSPIAGWLRSLAGELHEELGGPGVGAVGMCFTGGFALAMMVDPWVTAPVLAQPSLPFCLGRARSADLNLSPEDLAAVKARAVGGQEVLGLRYRGDLAVGRRFDTLRRELGDAFIAVEFDGRRHSTLTEHRQQTAVDRVLEFFDANLRTG